MPYICGECGSLKWTEDSTGVETSYSYDRNGKVRAIDNDTYGEVNSIKCFECRSDNVWQFEDGYLTKDEVRELHNRVGLERFKYMLQLAWKYRSKEQYNNPLLVSRRNNEIEEEAHNLDVNLEEFCETEMNKVC